MKNILLICIYSLQPDSQIKYLLEQFRTTFSAKIDIRLVALTKEKCPYNFPETVLCEIAPKFTLLNKILSKVELSNYDYLLVVDDDISIPDDFINQYFEAVEKYDFALAQPCRSVNSFIDWPFVRQISGINARETRFVEIGPLFSLRSDLFNLFVPFDETSPMGWGHDFVWPLIVSNAGKKMGIIDYLAIDHIHRKPASNYNNDKAESDKLIYLNQTPHLSKNEAFRILKSFI